MKSGKSKHNMPGGSNHSKVNNPHSNPAFRGSKEQLDYEPVLDPENNYTENTPPSGMLLKGRGSSSNPTVRFEKISLEILGESSPAIDDFTLDPAQNIIAYSKGPSTEFFDDSSKSIVTENNSPDISYRWSINPYRGCEHGCTYCYARPYHEYLGLSAGLDFEQKIIVKRDAAKLLRDWISRPEWQGERLALSGITDPYQPVEAKLKITRQILELLVQTHHCVTMITKNALVARDIDLLSELAGQNLTGIALSITTLDSELARSMEPRTSSPEARLRTVKQLSEAGIPVHVNLAPIIPGLNEHEIPQLVQAAADHGATSVGMQLVRLPGAVTEVFSAWLENKFPDRHAKIISRIQAMRDGKLNEAQFGLRIKGSGPLAESIQQTFRLWAKRCHLDGGMPKLNESLFTPPADTNGQLRLF